MPETNGDVAPKVVMITGGTGLVGEGIKEAVAKDPKVKEISEGEGGLVFSVVRLLLGSTPHCR